MKDELKDKYVPPSFNVRLMDKWHQYAQDNKSVKEYIAKFDEFLIRCSTSVRKYKLKSFLGLEQDLEKTFELNI